MLDVFLYGFFRGSLEIPRRRQELEDPRRVAMADGPECTAAADRGATCCRVVALIVSSLHHNFSSPLIYEKEPHLVETCLVAYIPFLIDEVSLTK